MSIPTTSDDDVVAEEAPRHVRGRVWVTDAQLAAIRAIDHFRHSEYIGLDLNRVLEEYARDFVRPLLRLAGPPRSVADIGAGYGWLGLAFALTTDAAVTIVEYDAGRLVAARRIAEVLGVDGRIEWVQGSIADLPLAERSMDAVYCVEVIEHTGVRAEFVRQLCRISRDVVVITTPNKLFPVINHDTALPFCHWLPLRLRDAYAGAFRRRHRQDNNRFWSPSALLGSVAGFERVSRFMQFQTFAEYRTHVGSRGRAGLLGACLNAYLAIASRLGPRAIYVLPNLASTFRRCDGDVGGLANNPY
jgi:2-polyprenyl-3-methyl-5-hydroxy-6-metoxy-1,4-benzoquinol methylase